MKDETLKDDFQTIDDSLWNIKVRLHQAEGHKRERWAIVRDGEEGKARIVIENGSKAIGGFMSEDEAQEFLAAHNGE